MHRKPRGKREEYRSRGDEVRVRSAGGASPAEEHPGGGCHHVGHGGADDGGHGGGVQATVSPPMTGPTSVGSRLASGVWGSPQPDRSAGRVTVPRAADREQTQRSACAHGGMSCTSAPAHLHGPRHRLPRELRVAGLVGSDLRERCPHCRIRGPRELLGGEDGGHGLADAPLFEGAHGEGRQARVHLDVASGAADRKRVFGDYHLPSYADARPKQSRACLTSSSAA